MVSSDKPLLNKQIKSIPLQLSCNILENEQCCSKARFNNKNDFVVKLCFYLWNTIGHCFSKKMWWLLSYLLFSTFSKWTSTCSSRSGRACSWIKPNACIVSCWNVPKTSQCFPKLIVCFPPILPTFDAQLQKNTAEVF